MKKYLIFLSLLIPLMGIGQFQVSYDRPTNTMSVHYTGCDICLLGNIHAVNRCECKLNCTDIEPTEEQYQEFEDCLEECEQYADDPVYQDYCLDGCEYQLNGIINSCKSLCGVVEPVRTIVGYQYTLVAAWDAIPFDPKYNKTNWEIFEKTEQANWVNIADWSPPDPWPEIYDGNNCCWGIGIRIYYSEPNGTIGYCDHEEWECNIIG